MIPSNIRTEHILQAIREIDVHGVPRNRTSRLYDLNYGGKRYPPKYVISRANKYANGSELAPGTFGGGSESETFFVRRGFAVSSHSERSQPPLRIRDTALKDRRATRTINGETREPVEHNGRCSECKATIREMLARLYGDVHTSYSLPFGVLPEDYSDSHFYPVMRDIYASLQEHRGNRQFVRAQGLPPVDYFVPSQGFVVEFDESQHFTECRRLTLSAYPDHFPVCFDVKRWTQLCSEIHAVDNDPQYRDEQRAWYDTVRDFAPVIHGMGPTVRLYADGYRWCSLDPNSADDKAWFERVLKSGVPMWDITPLYDEEPWIARIIVNGVWSGSPKDASALLQELCDIWENDQQLRALKTQFVMTCGGFLEFEWPSNVTRSMIGDPWNPRADAMGALFGAAQSALLGVLTPALLERLGRFTDYITVGVDSFKEMISTTSNYISVPHVEFVCLVSTKTGHLVWTGKSYPTNAQESGLLRVENLETHFAALPEIGNVMILGCHDLNVFNNRNLEHTGARRIAIKDAFRRMSLARKPEMILHHPHTTPSPRTWASAWAWVGRELRSVKRYASAGGYYDDRKELAPLDDTDVLARSKRGDSLDFVVYSYLS